MAAKTRRNPRKQAQPDSPAPADGLIAVWEDDPASGGSPIQVSAPVLPDTGLTFSIIDFPAAPPPQIYSIASNESRYWIALESLHRSLSFWRSILDSETPSLTWQWKQNTLPVRIASLVDLNAYYSRDRGLEFGHQNVKTGQIYTSDSPDITAHELGHAVLDALRPELFDAPSEEVNAFHESFGDISSLLSTLQLKSFRRAVIEETEGNLQYNSRLSRLAEQIASGIRERRPDTVEADCMRNAANSFFYADPALLEPSGPAIILTSSRHSFSRVFTGAFLEALAGITYAGADGRTPGEADIRAAVQVAGKLLIRAVREAAFVPGFFHEIAVRMVLADRSLFDSKYQKDLISAFVRRGILQVEEVSQLQNPGRSATRKAMAVSDRASAASALPDLQIPGSELGFGNVTIVVPFGEQFARSLSLTDRPLKPSSAVDKAWEASAKLFLKNLVRRGRIDVASGSASFPVIYPPRFAEGKRTHTLESLGNNVAKIKRSCFDF
jgi:hypothetical protein